MTTNETHKEAGRTLGRYSGYDKIEEKYMPETQKQIHDAAAALGRLGGLRNTKAQREARSANAKLGGYPAGRPRPKANEPAPAYERRLRKWKREQKARVQLTSSTEQKAAA